MDTTETYIKMADCPEIQELSPFNRKAIQWIEVGSWYAEGVSEGDIVCFGSIGADYKWYKEHRNKQVIWLPRQDQLQEMIKSEDENLVEFRERIICGFSAWCEVLRMTNDFRDYLSMEQLWLAFVMKEKYNKVWNGEDWKDRS